MLEATVRLTNTLGLHARAAAQLVRLANRFKSSIILKRSDSNVTANAKSILSVLSIAASFGVELQVVADGEDEAEALGQIEKLFADKFGEE
ncbi:MAG TPA: HPr family phosphocarrier protein [Pyrinomonadaceae bacterium]|jgi:phosphotransferase system HPr (HPr) family protein|nr:HPr family phosphocarrier protein [Pyrinomonadaceae bacterium]